MNSETPPSELAWIDWIRRQQILVSGSAARVSVGDDCAVLDLAHATGVLITTDLLLDGRHFRLDRHAPQDVGFKAMGVNLSDIAAMAGRPRAAVVAVALPRDAAFEIAQGIHTGLAQMAAEFGVDLVGGDTNTWDGPLVVCVTVVGESPRQGAILRSGACPGDAILVTGTLGGSSFRDRHLRPTPRVQEASVLAATGAIHAMIDLSDGLSSDLPHILRESGQLGAILEEEAIPIHADAFELSRCDGISPLTHALNDGEDFELCLVCRPEDEDRLRSVAPPSITLQRIGVVTPSPPLYLRRRDGTLREIEPGGFDHFRS